jgi:preprotein translocase subunit SecE
MNFFAKIKEYLTGVSAEGKRVTWPGKRELWESTLVVVSFIFILAATTLVYDKVIKGFLDIVLARPGA